jgi:hypothetical protein
VGSHSVVLNDRLNAVSSWTNNLLGGDLKFPPLAHCIRGVRNKIGRDLEQLTFSDMHLLKIIELCIDDNF